MAIESAVELPCSVGLDTNKSKQLVEPGSLYDCLNYEVDADGGYKVIRGMVPYDGQFDPTLIDFYYVTVTVAASGKGAGPLEVSTTGLSYFTEETSTPANVLAVGAAFPISTSTYDGDTVTNDTTYTMVVIPFPVLSAVPATNTDVETYARCRLEDRAGNTITENAVSAVYRFSWKNVADGNIPWEAVDRYFYALWARGEDTETFITTTPNMLPLPTQPSDGGADNDKQYGSFYFGGDLYVLADKSGQTYGEVYKTSSSGWTTVDMGQEMAFNTGTQSLRREDYLKWDGSGQTSADSLGNIQASGTSSNNDLDIFPGQIAYWVDSTDSDKEYWARVIHQYTAKGGYYAPSITACAAASVVPLADITAPKAGDTIDGYVTQTNDRVLIKNQTDASENGIWIYGDVAPPTRATDYDANTEATQNSFIPVTNGTKNRGTSWYLANSDPDVGTTNLIFVQDTQAEGALTIYDARKQAVGGADSEAVDADFPLSETTGTFGAWTEGNAVNFTTGNGTTPVVGDYIEDSTSEVDLTVLKVIIDSGTFAGGDATGTLVCGAMRGAVTYADIDSANAAAGSYDLKDGGSTTLPDTYVVGDYLRIAGFVDTDNNGLFKVITKNGTRDYEVAPVDDSVTGFANETGVSITITLASIAKGDTLSELSAATFTIVTANAIYDEERDDLFHNTSTNLDVVLPQASDVVGSSRVTSYEHNFFATDGSANPTPHQIATNAIYVCTGAGFMFSWDGTNLVRIRTGALVSADKPRHVSVHANRLMLGYGDGTVTLSVSGEPRNFRGVDGAQVFGYRSGIVGLLPLAGDTSAIITKKSVETLQGTDDTNMVQREVADDMGGIEYTAVNMGYPMYTDRHGIAVLQQTERYGDFNRQRVSSRARNWLTPRLDNSYTGPLLMLSTPELGGGQKTVSKASRTPEFALGVPSKNQYRLFFGDGMVMTCTMWNDITQDQPVLTLQSAWYQRVDSFITSSPCWGFGCTGINSVGRDLQFYGNHQKEVFYSNAYSLATGTAYDLLNSSPHMLDATENLVGQASYVIFNPVYDETGTLGAAGTHTLQVHAEYKGYNRTIVKVIGAETLDGTALISDELGGVFKSTPAVAAQNQELDVSSGDHQLLTVGEKTDKWVDNGSFVKQVHGVARGEALILVIGNDFSSFNDGTTQGSSFDWDLGPYAEGPDDVKIGTTPAQTLQHIVIPTMRRKIHHN